AARAFPDVALAMSDRTARAALYRHGPAAFSDAVRRRWAETPDHAESARRLLGLAESWARPPLPVGGRDLAALGVEPGPETGRLLRAFEEAWIADDFPTAGHAERLQALVNPRRA